jgi:predicted flap endonuclease-1-like 5' DNA nuclease
MACHSSQLAVFIIRLAEVSDVSTTREDRAQRVSDVRRGTRELLARIRQERIDRANKTVPVAVIAYHREEPATVATLMPDPLVTIISEQLVANGLSAVAPDIVPLQPEQAPSSRREASAPGRITRHYDSARLGISPVNKDDATLRLDLSVSHPTRATAETQRFARLAGLQPFEPLKRAGSTNAPGDTAAEIAVDTDVEGAQSGIESIPTLGPGLVWRLSEAGIRSMADLAACDAASIRTKLGQLGRLVKVEDWIAHARAVVAGAGAR